jgi:hypothetical protein
MRKLLSLAFIPAALLATRTQPPPQVLRADVLEFLSHITMVDLPNGQGGTVRAVRIEGLNVQIVNGMGSTESVNGLGNLVVGYNEIAEDENLRTGSHNIVGGMFTNYSSYGGLVVGLDNRISAPFASISGGASGQAMAPSSSISGGRQNNTLGECSSISGGETNTANGTSSSVSGGAFRTAAGTYDWVAGSLWEDQ